MDHRLNFFKIVSYVGFLVLFCGALLGCSSVEMVGHLVDEPSDMQDVVDVAAELSPQDYYLQSGDVIAVTVYGEQDLSREYRIDPQGLISMPLIGDVAAAGQTVLDVKQDILKELKNGY